MTLDKNKTGASRNIPSIDAQLSDVTKTIDTSTQCIQYILTAHPTDDPICDCTNSCDILIDTVISAEAMTGAHIADQKYQEYYNWRDQQYIAYKYNRGLKQVNWNWHKTLSKKTSLQVYEPVRQMG